MMMEGTRFAKVKPAGVLMGRLAHGADLLEELTALCREQGIRLGRITGIGAVTKVRLSFYDQAKREYLPLELDGPLEILSLEGNVSLRDGEPFVHAHMTLSDGTGRTFGGHLARGTEVFACECVVEAYEGVLLERGLDDATGLFLWARPR